ncbi:Alpha/beta hydrolase [gamma proteobacterium HdN1]|nr:Alpha/beta hydrolase [gamma proteobacterium HdN1]
MPLIAKPVPLTKLQQRLEDGAEKLMMTIVQKAVGLKLQQIKIPPDCTVHYFDNGNLRAQETLVLLHGFGANKNLWMHFASFFKEYRVLIPDLAGHGQTSYREGIAHTIGYHTQFVRQWLDALQISQAHFVGNSMGGWIAAQYAISYPNSVITLTIMDAAGVRSPVESTVSKLMAKGENVFFFEDEAGYDRLANLAMVSPPALPKIIKRAQLRAFLTIQPRLRRMFTDITENNTFAESQLLDHDLDKIKAPTLIVWGASDQVTDVAASGVFLQGISGSRRVILENVGHVPMVEKAADTAKAYRNFLESCR